MTSDSDSDSLPSLAELLPQTSNEIHSGDIVWAKFKNLYWPALVRHIYPKEKKMTVWFTDDPGKCFKLPYKKICLFHNPERTKQIKKEAEEAGVIEAHDGLTSHARSYLSRKAEGFKDDPMKFFDQTYPFFLMENWLKSNPAAHKDTAHNIKIPPLYISHERSTSMVKKKSIKYLNSSSPDLGSDVESVCTDSDTDVNIDGSKAGWEVKREPSDIFECNYVTKLIDCIKSRKSDKYLEDILSKKIFSEYDKIYEMFAHTNKQDLNCVTYGPVKNMVQMRELINYLLDLFDRVPHDSGVNKIEKAQYLASVWLPESILFAISEVSEVSLMEAKIIFKKFESNKETIESVLSYIDKNIEETQNIDIADSSENIKKEEINKNGNEELKYHTSYVDKNLSVKTCSVTLDHEIEIDSKNGLKNPASASKLSCDSKNETSKQKSKKYKRKTVHKAAEIKGIKKRCMRKRLQK